MVCKEELEKYILLRMTQKEIATIMQSTEGSVEQLLQRAKSNLQKKLSPMVGK